MMASIFFTERLLALPNSGQRPMHAYAGVLNTVMHWFSDGQKSRNALHFRQQTSQIEPSSQSRLRANSPEPSITKRYQSIKASFGMLWQHPGVTVRLQIRQRGYFLCSRASVGRIVFARGLEW
jgi:hypothetical protein